MGMSGSRLARVGVLAVSLGIGAGMPMVAFAQSDNDRTTRINTDIDITRETTETTDLSTVDGDQTTTEAPTIIVGDIVTGHNDGNDVALRDTVGVVTIDGGEASSPTYIGLNVNSDLNDVYQDSEYSESTAATDNTVDVYDPSY